jgi:hypothetical protein
MSNLLKPNYFRERIPFRSSRMTPYQGAPEVLFLSEVHPKCGKSQETKKSRRCTAKRSPKNKILPESLLKDSKLR